MNKDATFREAVSALGIPLWLLDGLGAALGVVGVLYVVSGSLASGDMFLPVLLGWCGAVVWLKAREEVR